MSDAAITPLADHVTHAVERMEAGARMILDSIPNDSSLSSSSFPSDVTQEIARQLQAHAILKQAIDDCKDDTWECQCGRSEPWWTGSNAHYLSKYPIAPTEGKP